MKPPATLLPFEESIASSKGRAEPDGFTIALVDDDEGVLRGLERLLKARGFKVRAYSSAEDFLGHHHEDELDCVVLDLSLPGIGGFEVQRRLSRSDATLPVIFLSGEADIATSVRAIKAGAANFLTKPVEGGELVRTLRSALAESDGNRTRQKELTELRKRFSSLSAREMEIFHHVIAGKLNKQIASDLGISEQTVKIHRMHITDKTGIPSVAELVRAACQLNYEPAY